MADMMDLARSARQAALKLSVLTFAERNRALLGMREALAKQTNSMHRSAPRRMKR